MRRNPKPNNVSTLGKIALAGALAVGGSGIGKVNNLYAAENNPQRTEGNSRNPKGRIFMTELEEYTFLQNSSVNIQAAFGCSIIDTNYKVLRPILFIHNFDFDSRGLPDQKIDEVTLEDVAQDPLYIVLLHDYVTNARGSVAAPKGLSEELKRGGEYWGITLPDEPYQGTNTSPRAFFTILQTKDPEQRVAQLRTIIGGADFAKNYSELTDQWITANKGLYDQLPDNFKAFYTINDWAQIQLIKDQLTQRAKEHANPESIALRAYAVHAIAGSIPRNQINLSLGLIGESMKGGEHTNYIIKNEKKIRCIINY